MLLIFATLLILIFSVFIIIKYETLIGVAIALGACDNFWCFNNCLYINERI